MTQLPITVRVHQLLASRWPEPASLTDIAQALGVGVPSVRRAVHLDLRAKTIVPALRMASGRGHAYTVAR